MQFEQQKVKSTKEQLACKLMNFRNELLTVQDVIREKQTLLLFVRHFNCYVCRDQVKNLNVLINQEELKKKNKKIIIVACSKPDAIQEFSIDTGFPKELILVSTDLEAYKAFGMKRAENFTTLKGQETNPDTTSGVISGMAWSLWKTITRGSQGDVYQLGGEVLLGEDGTILFQKSNGSSQDYLQAKQIKELLGVE